MKGGIILPMHGSYPVCYDLSQLTNRWSFQPCLRHRPHERNDAARDIQKVALNVASRRLFCGIFPIFVLQHLSFVQKHMHYVRSLSTWDVPYIRIRDSSHD